ncbi:MAG: nitrile hydratase subunit alpha, partial [Gammaproteobacteria bacterium]
DAWVDAHAETIGPKNGAKVIARSWVDEEFKARLLEDAGAAIEELGLLQGHLTAVENTDNVHNLVVCTLCSCYPMGLLGMAPSWYKMAAYRSRAVREPRKVLEEFGVQLSPDIPVRVWDSTAELRYLVVPQRPAGTEDWDEERLAGLVTRNAMIGTARDLSIEEQD